MRIAFFFLFGLLLVSCHGSDSMFTELVGTYCAKDAEIKCAFARDAVHDQPRSRDPDPERRLQTGSVIRLLD